MSIPQIYHDLLTGGTFVRDEDVNKRAEWLAEGVKEHHFKSKGRSDETIMRHSTKGVICELGTCASLKGSMNDQTFDYKVRSTYAYDLTALTGSRVEVKLHKDKYFSFYIDNIKTMLNNIAENAFDYLVTSSFYRDEKHNGYVVYPRLVINPKTFRQYATTSNYGRNKPMWYNHHEASRDGECIILNEGAISRLQEPLNVV